MKRQNSLLSSSSQVEISSDNLSSRRRRSQTFGCVSGLLHFLSNNQSRRRNKSITFVHNNQEHDAISESKSPILSNPKPETAANLQNFSSDSPRIACRTREVEESAIPRAEKFGGARGPIVRLMGLENWRAEGGVPVAEKQRQVMEGLEKCEEELKALKEFIDAFELAESFRSSSPAATGEGKRIEFMIWEQKQQQQSPASLVEELSRPRRFVDVHGCNRIFSHRPSANSGRIQSQQRQQMQRKKPGEEDIFNLRKFDGNKIHELVGNWKGEKPTESPLYSSKAMRESVEGVCKDIAWAQKKEVGRIGLALQHQICGDLIEDLVKDLKFSYKCRCGFLPFEACKRRLCF